jgi:mannose-6-phosphate isomerase
MTAAPKTISEYEFRTLYQPGQRDDRPWGTWEIMDVGNGYAVKRIVVKPGGRLSLQRHEHRKEHWVVVEGSAKVTQRVDGEEVTRTTMVPAGGIAIIGLRDVHRIENPSAEEFLIFIEVQHGKILDENDIERLEDDYDRI